MLSIDPCPVHHDNKSSEANVGHVLSGLYIWEAFSTIRIVCMKLFVKVRLGCLSRLVDSGRVRIFRFV